MASTTKVSNYLISPGTNRGRHPATMGSSWSCNMFREVNDGNEYIASVPGLKYVRNVGHGACRGAYVSSVGLSAHDQNENAFVVFGSTVYRIDWTGNLASIGGVAAGDTRVSFAETGGLRPMT